ncbi:V-set and immunoglobulin domain-containing protein 2 isoform X2 [Hyla sarda]|uniref:V-set and immunoglobulin domain-containing protein 2 isoform X2 n=1 Tax=Hyla sarda TaxID=327740 RepID=UPI0024C3BA07|nr:V-set and immunoglobulin domain-containing protein 2 isoform X2 [Hyla sarda]
MIQIAGWVHSVTVITPERTVVGKAGSTVVLPCQYSTTVGSQFVVEWKFLPGNTQTAKWQQIYYYSDGTTYKPGSQADRLTAVHHTPTSGAASIQLTDISSLDNGTYVCEVNNPPDFSGSGSGIIQLSVLDEVTGSLLLTNLSAPMSGTYLCTASNEMGKATCEVTISVSGASEAGVVAGAVIGVLLALILIAAILLYLFCYRNRRKETAKSDHPGNEIREDAVSPMMGDEQRRSRDSHHSQGSRDRSENRARVV